MSIGCPRGAIELKASTHSSQTSHLSMPFAGRLKPYGQSTFVPDGMSTLSAGLQGALSLEKIEAQTCWPSSSGLGLPSLPVSTALVNERTPALLQQQPGFGKSGGVCSDHPASRMILRPSEPDGNVVPRFFFEPCPFCRLRASADTRTAVQPFEEHVRRFREMPPHIEWGRAAARLESPALFTFSLPFGKGRSVWVSPDLAIVSPVTIRLLVASLVGELNVGAVEPKVLARARALSRAVGRARHVKVTLLLVESQNGHCNDGLPDAYALPITPMGYGVEALPSADEACPVHTHLTN